VTDPFAITDPVVRAVDGDTLDCDVAILGSGMGGATLAWALRRSGARVLVVERGGFLVREPENWSPEARSSARAATRTRRRGSTT
jgi:flavin-dependent dehydrogenase